MNTLVPRTIFASLAFVAAAAAAAEFHVAPNGNDADPGTDKKSFATPARAIEAVRALVSSGLNSDVQSSLPRPRPSAGSATVT